MTVEALLKKSGKELLEWYTESSVGLWEAEGKARDAMKYDEDHWRAVYAGHETQFRDALDIKFKLAIITYVESLGV